jgi:hypothetical protein
MLTSTSSTVMSRPAWSEPVLPVAPPALKQTASTGGQAKLREVFDEFVGQSFYGLMLKSLRESTQKPAYFHGGRGEEVFQGQLDQRLVEEMSKASGDQFTGPMFELFNLSRNG